jgi:hypothetical protein
MHLLFLLLACTSDDKPNEDTAPADPDTDTDTDTDIDHDTDPVDADLDGFDSSIDCNDADATINQGAAEACDGIDNDCDEFVDEDFDQDDDGALTTDGCATGTDCDDTNDDIGPGEADVPYDAVDQDCSGADLTDVDGDGVDGGTGPDCDDADATVAPGAPEIAKDGIDQDCDGVDSLDSDADGADDSDFGGDDCDDADPAVRPGARDYWNDGLDSDCDGADTTAAALEDAPVTISGDAGSQDLVGQDVALCDLDGDTLLDLVVTAPFGESYLGQVGIWYGDGAASWGPGMLIDDADTLIQSSEMFLGFDIGCEDLDGDGFDDLVTGRGEINASPYLASFELVIWYGDGAKFGAALSEADSDATLEMALGAPLYAYNVYGRNLTVADLDDDGAAEIVLPNAADDNLAYADDRFYVLPGGRYAGTLQLVDEASAAIDGQGVDNAVALPDLDGDGAADLLLGESAYTVVVDLDDTYPGRASIVSAGALADGAVTDLRYGGWQGAASEQLGNDGTVGDFDGDGLLDLAVGAFQESTNADAAGALYLFSPAEAAVPADGLSSEGVAMLGTGELGWLGFRSENVGDLDGDGADDLLVSEPYGSESDASAYYGRIWLVSGAEAVGGASLEDAALLAWSGESVYSTPGLTMAVGDIDADGEVDFVVGAYGYSEDGIQANGKVYLLLSGS